MVRFIFGLLVPLIANAAGLLAAARFIPGFELEPDPKNIVALALVLALLNLLLKPVLKLLIGPLIVLTLGAGVVIVNVFILGFLDFFAPGLNIGGFEALLLGTLMISVINVFTDLIFRP